MPRRWQRWQQVYALATPRRARRRKAVLICHTLLLHMSPRRAVRRSDIAFASAKFVRACLSRPLIYAACTPHAPYHASSFGSCIRSRPHLLPARRGYQTHPDIFIPTVFSLLRHRRLRAAPALPPLLYSAAYLCYHIWCWCWYSWDAIATYVRALCCLHTYDAIITGYIAIHDMSRYTAPVAFLLPHMTYARPCCCYRRLRRLPWLYILFSGRVWAY